MSNLYEPHIYMAERIEKQRQYNADCASWARAMVDPFIESYAKRSNPDLKEPVQRDRAAESLDLSKQCDTAVDKVFKTVFFVLGGAAFVASLITVIKNHWN